MWYATDIKSCSNRFPTQRRTDQKASRRAISILDSLTKNEIPHIKVCAAETLKKLRLGEDFYPYEKLITSIFSIIDMDKEEVTPRFYELREKSLNKDFNKALCQAVILPRITEDDAEGLKKFLRVISPYTNKNTLLMNILKTIYKYSNKDSKKAISFLVKWYEVDHGKVFLCLYQSMRKGSMELQRFMAQCFCKIYEKNDPSELFDRIKKWVRSEEVVNERHKKRVARGTVIILRELSIIHLDKVIELLREWLKTENPYILDISISTLVEIAQFKSNE